MKTDYEYYLLGCRFWGEAPLSRWRFTVSYAKYRQMLRAEMDVRRGHTAAGRSKMVARWDRLRHLAALVKQGQDIAARAGRFDDGEAGTAGAGDREPRTPLVPVLCGCSARSLPSPDLDAFVERQL